MGRYGNLIKHCYGNLFLVLFVRIPALWVQHTAGQRRAADLDRGGGGAGDHNHFRVPLFGPENVMFEINDFKTFKAPTPNLPELQQTFLNARKPPNPTYLNFNKPPRPTDLKSNRPPQPNPPELHQKTSTSYAFERFRTKRCSYKPVMWNANLFTSYCAS